MHPYGPPPGYGYEQAPRRTGAPKTLGILSIVFGSLVTLSSFVGFFGSGLFKAPPGTGLAWERYMEDIRTGQLINSGLLFFMSIALVVIGIGQVKYRRWASKASVYWALAAFVVLIILFVVHLTILGPAMTKFFEDAGSIGKQMGGMSNTMAFVSLLLYAPYPIVLLTTFRKPNVVAAMTN